MPSIIRRRRWLVALLGAVLAVATGGLAYASIPGATRTISGCYSKSNGALRVIDAETGASCAANKELALSWSQQGPPGPQGIQGPPGPTGPAINTNQVLATTSAVENTSEGFDLKFAVALCATGEIATGGGYRIGAARPVEAQVTVTDSVPSTRADEPGAPPDAWSAFAIAPTGVGHWELSAYAICTAPPVGP